MMYNKEIKNRIKVCVAAYAYEVLNESIISDAEFDALCREIDPQVTTGNILLDKFFKTEFDPSTGSWIHKHPQLDKIKSLMKYYSEGG